MALFKLFIVLFMSVAVATGSAVEAQKPAPSKESSVELVLLVQGGDSEGGAVKGAEVYVRLGDSREFERRTNKKGRAVFKNLLRGPAKVKIIAPGWKPFVQVYHLSERRQEISIKLEKRD
jgi:hypothetical protein